MRKTLNLFALAFALAATVVLPGCKDDDVLPVTPVVKPNIVFYGISGTNQLLSYNAMAPETAISTMPVTGLGAGENLLAIDFRPATGQLYGITGASRLYVINPVTGAATAIGTTAFTPAISGTIAGFDFNPTVDRIRLVTNTGQNLRLHPETGAVAATDGNLNPGTPSVAGAAYTNSFSGASSTELYDLDLSGNNLVKQMPPNDGTLVTVGSLTVTATGEAGFDISSDNAVALASLTVGGQNGLYQVDLTSGKATNLGNLSTALVGIAIPTRPVAYASDDAGNLLIFNPTAPGTPVSKTISGLQTGETILGMDMRPATGQLYVLGSTSRLYTINLGTGGATVVGSQFGTLLSGSNFGFDFNPTVDRIRIVSNTGQNLRVHPVTGAIAFVDGSVTPVTVNVAGAAYTNNFPTATTTTLYTLDMTSGKLFTQNPPNDGTQVEVGALGVTVSANNGFDIGGVSGKAYALLTVSGATKLYSINLTTGAATAPVDFPVAVRSFALGLGF